ncbi:hypothetical protein FNV43_RR07305 [Rhamnella rubrinervis]|uniref:MBD domain-containing protein n=1 Tax=Rhamnella rubrinervis TaxID=2594499 RepID=A0A8K0HEP8_9ROSA|nr:hypothetical protein FNV43_RR07305 [Rhamnella rubrinervis]
MGYTLHGKPQSTNRLIERHPGKNPLQGLVNGKDTNPEWLPNGWKVELKTRKSGLKMEMSTRFGFINLFDLCYVDPLNRRKFYSKPEVFRYLSTVKHKGGMFGRRLASRCTLQIKSPSSEAKRHTLKHPTTRRQIFSSESSIDGVKAEIVQDSLANEIQDCAETKQNGALNRSPWSKARGHKISQRKRSKLPETEECKKTQGKADVVKGLASTPAPDILPEKNSIPPVMENKNFRKPQMTTGRSKDKKFLNLPRRSSKRLAAGLQRDQVVNLMSGEQGLSSIPATDVLLENNSIPPVMEKKSFKKPQMTSSRSKDKKFLNLPRRSSKRLSGERALEFSIGKSSKIGAILDACLTSDSMVNGGSTQHEFGQEKELECHASTDTSTPLYGKKTTSQLSVESDPCLEFAFKTLTGELPVADAADDWATLITEPGMLQHENLHESGIKRSSDETGWVNLRKSKKKKMFILPGRSSMRLAGLEPELVANSLAGEGFLENTIKKSHKNNDPPATDSADEVIEQLWAVREAPIAGQRIELGNHFSAHADTSPEIKLENLNLNISLHEEPSDMQLDRGQGIELSHYFSNDVDISTHAEPSNKSEKSVEDPLIPEKQPHTQAQMGDLEKPEPELAFSLGDCWSDPCLGFSFKTLTGVIPIEDNLVPAGYFREQLETSNQGRP